MGKISFTCECGKAVRVDAKHAGQRGRCPSCGMLVTIPSAPAAAVTTPSGPEGTANNRPAETAIGNPAHQHAVSTELPERMRANRTVAGRLCTICQTAIATGEDVHNCSRCKSSYHAECWEQAGGCGTYGCENSPASKGAVSGGPASSPPTRLGPDALAPRMTPVSLASAIPRGRPVRRRWRSRTLVLAAIGGLGAIVIIIMLLGRSAGLRQKLDGCSSRSGIQVRVYYDQYLSKQDVVFDFQGVTGMSVRRIDPVHLLLQFGHKLDETDLRRLVLARNGRKLMYIERADLRELTREYTYGNPVWSFNHLPERLKTMSGANAYSRWKGGWLGVLEKQTEDLNRLIADWTGS